jgi:hypothetical protein
MLKRSGGYVFKVRFIDLLTLLLKLLDDCLLVDRVPNHDNIGEQIQSFGSYLLLRFLLFSDDAVSSKPQIEP